MHLEDTNLDLGVKHMQKLMIAINIYRTVPQKFKREYADKARMHARLIRMYADSSKDQGLLSIAREAEDVIKSFKLTENQ